MTHLAAREERSRVVRETSEKWHLPVLTVKGNVVGNDKNPFFMSFVLTRINESVRNRYKSHILLEKQIDSIDGNYSIYVIEEAAENLKKTAMELEETDMGRLVDIDVFYGQTYTREDFHKEARRCYICNEAAFVCARSRRHLTKDLLNKMADITKEYVSSFLYDITDQAILDEVTLYPSFGLVSKEDSGCHTDMDYKTFIVSKNALEKGIKAYIKSGYEIDIDSEKLKSIGQSMEKDMFEATKGINTHKGLIFLLGVFLPSLSHAIYYNKLDTLSDDIREISKNIIGNYYEELDHKKALSNSDKIYLKHQIKGIRQEAMNGLQHIFSNPVEEEHSHTRQMNDLLYFMSVLDDTTIIHKRDLQTLKRVQKEAKDILLEGGYKSNKDKVHDLSLAYKKESISPGASADMLVIMMIYRKVRHYITSQ